METTTVTAFQNFHRNLMKARVISECIDKDSLCKLSAYLHNAIGWWQACSESFVDSFYASQNFQDLNIRMQILLRQSTLIGLAGALVEAAQYATDLSEEFKIEVEVEG